MGCGANATGRAHQAFLRDAGLPAAEVLTPESLNAMRAIAKRQGITAEQSAIKVKTEEKTTGKQRNGKGYSPEALQQICFTVRQRLEILKD